METRKNVNRIFIYGLLTVLAILVVIPFGWMLLASVKTSNEVFSIPMRLLPKEFQWVNYQTIWEKIPLLTFLKIHFKLPSAPQPFRFSPAVLQPTAFQKFSLREEIPCF